MTNSEFLIYQAVDGKITIDVRLEGNSIYHAIREKEMSDFQINEKHLSRVPALQLLVTMGYE